MLVKAKGCQGPAVLGNMEGKPSGVRFMRSWEARMLSRLLCMLIYMEEMSLLVTARANLNVECTLLIDGSPE